MLLRDVNNLKVFFGQFAPELLATDYGPEMWAQYQRGVLRPDTALTGRYTHASGPVDVRDVMGAIDDARMQEQARLLRMQAGH